jgi:RNA polymerase sigma factor (sigma-70 family)
VHSGSDKTLRDFLEKDAAKKPDLAPGVEPFPTTWRAPTSHKRQQELHMWRKWKDSGETPEDMEPLLDSLQPLVNKRIRQFQGVPIQREVLRAEANRKVIGGLRRFDPEKAQMHTFLTHELKGVRRYVQHHQNLSRIVEERANKIGDYQRSYSTLADQFDREPTAHELADHMKVSVKTVTRLQGELRQDLLASGAMEDPFVDETPRSREVLKLIPYELTPTEMQVFEYLTGYGGKPKLTSTGEIARRLGWSDSKVSQVKNSISQKIRKYL